ncbi:glucosamine-6-phosphate deaminase [Pontibacillus yanchengensis]|uniref:Glucosamine-6-phosphate deaminase n=2 Tax=Pontibacillus yanchengensis TaxID=462910 RepID=A0ACC7VEU5_9BACI|nr:glucosamine-6-phosphate deaminase [Pontibacillus yanchengensis]MYL33935.1 glucosamine-6-phosphate deaminase [Pontibacillus yanchengensis]MYL53968.1 glucosamine-6-phosphate deaminase [Pontibacillus yanchengensis]
MKIYVTKDKKEMNQKAAEIILERIQEKPDMTLGLATGGTPEGTYDDLVNDYQQHGTSYQNITTFNLDEYVGLPSDDPNSYLSYMREHLFHHIDIPLEQTNLPNGIAEDLEAECDEYEMKIHGHGGIDLQLLGIGENGHIGFNEPGTAFGSKTHVVELAESTREANARFFDSKEDVPTHAITMGIQTILKSKEILLLISGERKQEALLRLLHGGVSEDFPASALKEHPNLTVIADEAAIENKSVVD